MSNSIPEEMLSAYLDDELSEADRLRVDEHLEQHADSRKTLTELRQIRDALKSLPQQVLSPDFAARITTQIKRTPDPVTRATGSSQTRLAALIATIAAMILLSVWGINFLPSLNVASQPTDSGREDRIAAPVPTGANLDESIADNSAVSRSDEPQPEPKENAFNSPSPPLQQQVEQESITQLKRKPRFAVQPASDKQEIDNYGLVVDYGVDTTQFANISKAWHKWKVPASEDSEGEVSQFVIEGTHREIATLLAMVNSQASKFEGKSMPEFEHRGLSSFFSQTTTNRAALEVALEDNKAAGNPVVEAAEIKDGAAVELAVKSHQGTMTRRAVTPPAPENSAQRFTDSVGKSINFPAEAANLETDHGDAEQVALSEEGVESGVANAAEPRIRILVRVRTSASESETVAH